MPQYRVYAIYTASKCIGVFDAPNEHEAKEMAENSEDTWASLCHQCADEMDLNDDPHKFEASLVND